MGQIALTCLILRGIESYFGEIMQTSSADTSKPLRSMILDRWPTRPFASGFLMAAECLACGRGSNGGALEEKSSPLGGNLRNGKRRRLTNSAKPLPGARS